MSPMIRIARLQHARELIEQSANAIDMELADALRATARKILREVLAESSTLTFARDENAA